MSFILLASVSSAKEQILQPLKTESLSTIIIKKTFGAKIVPCGTKLFRPWPIESRSLICPICLRFQIFRNSWLIILWLHLSLVTLHRCSNLRIVLFFLSKQTKKFYSAQNEMTYIIPTVLVFGLVDRVIMTS